MFVFNSSYIYFGAVAITTDHRHGRCFFLELGTYPESMEKMRVVEVVLAADRACLQLFIYIFWCCCRITTDHCHGRCFFLGSGERHLC